MDYATKTRLGLKRRPKSENLKAVIAAVILVALWAVVSEMDYQDAVAGSVQTRCIYRGI